MDRHLQGADPSGDFYGLWDVHAEAVLFDAAEGPGRRREDRRMLVCPDLLAHHPAAFETGLGDLDDFYVHGVVDESDVALDRGEYAYEIYAAGRTGLFPRGARYGLDASHGGVDDDDPADFDRLFIQSAVLRRGY